MRLRSFNIKIFMIFQFFLFALFCGAKSFAITVVDIRSLEKTDPTLLAVTAAAGLENREQPTVYTLRDEIDIFWKEQLSLADNVSMTPRAFLEQMVRKYGVVLYSPTDIRFLPSIVTFAGVHDAIPLEGQFYKTFFSFGKIVADFSNRWNDDHTAVSETAQAMLKNTTTLAVQSGAFLQQGFLVDQIVARKMFVEYLKNGCIPLTKDHGLLKKIVSSSPWEKPVQVFGYNDINMLLGGYVFEAETNCINVLGQVPTQASMNLSFLSKLDTSYVPPMLGKPATKTYSPNKIYLNFVYGDMDNIDFVKGFGHANMQKRAELCKEKGGDCFPLTWTLSPNLRTLAPAIARWYYDKAASTGRDEFIMPPSGASYSYPGKMPDDVQSKYVSKLVDAADWMGTSGSIHWEWMHNWDSAFRYYFPKYKEHNNKNWAFFLNNVPWPVPLVSTYIYPWENYKWIADNVVVFKRLWNWEFGGGTGGKNWTPAEFTKRINKLTPGTVGYIYTIQIVPPEQIFKLVELLDKDKVEVVSSQDLISLSKQRDHFLGK